MSSDFIKIRGKEISFVRELMPVSSLKYLPDNPRVYSLISDEERKLGYGELQEVIHQKMVKEENVKSLVNRIRKAGGLMEDIFINAKNEVVEGNCRLASHRLLQKEDDHNWNYIPCKIVSLTEIEQAVLLFEMHGTGKGKGKWKKYENATFVWQLVKEKGWSIEDAAKEAEVSVNEVRTLIKAKELQDGNKDSERSNFSYYDDVMVRNRTISSACEENADLKEFLLQEIKKEKKEVTAQDLRNQLPSVIAKPEILKEYTEGKIDLESAYYAAKPSSILKYLKNARVQLANIFDNYHTPEDRKIFAQRELGSCKIEARRVRKELKKVDNFLSACEKIKNKG